MLTVVLEHDSQNSVSPLRREEPTSARTKELLSTKATTALLSKKPRKGPLADLDNHKLHAEEVYDMIAISDNEDSPPPNPKENSQKPPAIVDDIAKESKSSATVDKDDAADEEDYTESTKDVAEASDDENDLSYDPKGKSPLNEEEDDDDELEEIAEDGDGVIGLDDYEDSVVPKTYGRHAKWCDNCGRSRSYYCSFLFLDQNLKLRTFQARAKTTRETEKRRLPMPTWTATWVDCSTASPARMHGIDHAWKAPISPCSQSRNANRAGRRKSALSARSHRTPSMKTTKMVQYIPCSDATGALSWHMSNV
ncbi:uncharacterized protein EV422DRAFT_141122 [Fimicolochytrium jonesii]|uniref:uncharacterized protein n=1 Tax=Fimicolochytrium jonesii TaxID=1396493 RepID=UPI0022FDE9AE|nr:uncharacterized protein EV422DRAFT_141122 [Fimicolochytrium jonesii]KAI8825796.1 hypothetical protein EV422DRAFT_141122 [Fimicolochytrium jonesii]